MAKYVDGFVLVVPKGKEAEYEEMAKMGRDSWMKHGALRYLEEELDEWDEQTGEDPRPTISLVCATLTDLIYAKRRTRGLMADIWEYEDEDRPHIRFTTAEKLRVHGVLAEEIWEVA